MATKKEKKADEKLLEDALDGLKRCVDSEDPERAKMRDDLRFATLDQWPADIRKEREGDVENGPRPCLTIDQINQYIVQVVNDIRQGKPSIKVRPIDDAADIETAKILQGLVRHIEDQSSADIAYMTAAESAAKIGLGFFRITTEYFGDETTDQEIVIRPIPDTFSTYLGHHIMPDGSDAEEAYIVEQMQKEEFKAKYPKANVDRQAFHDLDEQTFWQTEYTITVAEKYYIEKTYVERIFLEDGSVVSREDYDAMPEPRPAIEDTRTLTKKKLYWCKFTGAEILEKRDLPGKYIPIVEVVGRETQVDGRRIVWGLVRPAKDSLRMYNYWASTITEKIALAPKTPYIGAVGQFASQSGRWAKANRLNYPYLEYDPIEINGNAAPAPRREPGTPIDAAMVQQLGLIKNDVKAALGMYKAAVGESDSQQSGRAILALQRESDTGTYHFGANMGISIRHAGRIIVDMIPHYYDTKRVVRIMGEDGEIQTAHLDPEHPQAAGQVQTMDGMRNVYNPSVGKYDVTITVGPSYNTKRMEAAATFIELSKGATDPGSAAVMRYLTVKNSDATGAEEAAKMLRSLLPPQVQQAMQNGNEGPIPPQAQAAMGQMQAKLQQLGQQAQELAQENQQLKARSKENAMKIQAAHQEKMAELQLEQQISAQRAQFDREKATAELHQRREAMLAEAALSREKALLEARTKIEVAEISAKATLQASQIAAASRAASEPTTRQQ